MKTLILPVMKDRCLGHTVFRGSALAKDLVEASWIDFHDLDRNPLGYQRPIDLRRSRAAAEYAEQADEAFWPECILAIRKPDAEDEDEAADTIAWAFQAMPKTDDRYGTLTITYDESRVETIANDVVPWKRALSQVDCQHRLGTMGSSTKLVTFCIFPEMTRRQEAIIFKTINDKQRKISTSLVDLIVLLTDPDAPPYIKWAYDLGNDAGSPFNRVVATGGRNLVPPARLVTLRTLQSCARLTLLPRTLTDGGLDLGYTFLRNYWTVIKAMWTTEFEDPRNFKLTTIPGLRGLSRFGRGIFQSGLAGC